MRSSLLTLLAAASLLAACGDNITTADINELEQLAHAPTAHWQITPQEKFVEGYALEAKTGGWFIYTVGDDWTQLGTKLVVLRGDKLFALSTEGCSGDCNSYVAHYQYAELYQRLRTRVQDWSQTSFGRTT